MVQNYDLQKPSVLNAVRKITKKSITSEDNKELLNESIRSAWAKNEDPRVKYLVSELAGSRVRNLGDVAAVEIIGKLGIWFAESGIEEL